MPVYSSKASDWTVDVRISLQKNSVPYLVGTISPATILDRSSLVSHTNGAGPVNGYSSHTAVYSAQPADLDQIAL